MIRDSSHLLGTAETVINLRCAVMGMKHNVGSADRAVRLFVGALLALIGVASIGGVVGFGQIAGAVAVLLGGVLLGTALTQSCPLYQLAGMDTSESA
jgi:hypothetical protein